MIRLILLLLALALGPGVALAQPATPGEPELTGMLAEPPALEPPDEETAKGRTREIASGLRCPVCQGLSVADSNTDTARAMYARIGELVRLGYSQEQIEDYFADRYGEWVRLAPPAEGLHWIIWVGPLIALVIGAAIVASRAGRGGAPAVAPAAPIEADDPYRQQILAELGEVSPESRA